MRNSLIVAVGQIEKIGKYYNPETDAIESGIIPVGATPLGEYTVRKSLHKVRVKKSDLMAIGEIIQTIYLE